MQLTSKGQVTIPKKYRDKYGLIAGVDVEFLDDEGELKLVKASQGKGIFDKVYGILKRESSTDKLIESLRGR